jgi:hypothetical protein
MGPCGNVAAVSDCRTFDFGPVKFVRIYETADKCLLGRSRVNRWIGRSARDAKYMHARRVNTMERRSTHPRECSCTYKIDRGLNYTKLCYAQSVAKHRGDRADLCYTSSNRGSRLRQRCHRSRKRIHHHTIPGRTRVFGVGRPDLDGMGGVGQPGIANRILPLCGGRIQVEVG